MCRRNLLAVMLLPLLLLTACAAFSPVENERRSDLDDFIYALRWQRYPEAASYFSGDLGNAFLDQMEALNGLNVTDVRLKRFEFKDGGLHAEARLEMDYYLLPSATLKTLPIVQTWTYFENKETAVKGFMITSPFPKLAEESLRKKGALPP